MPVTAVPKVDKPFDALPAEILPWFHWARSLPPAFTGGDWSDIRADLIATYESRGGVRHPFGALPTIVLSAGNMSFDDEKEVSAEVQRTQHERGQADLATLSSNSRLIVAMRSGHYIHLEEPDLVVEVIRQVVDAARRKGSLCCKR